MSSKQVGKNIVVVAGTNGGSGQLGGSVPHTQRSQQFQTPPKLARNLHPLHTTKVYKEFPVHGWFWGTVVAYFAASHHYRIVYSYNDHCAINLVSRKQLTSLIVATHLASTDSHSSSSSKSSAARRLLDDDSILANSREQPTRDTLTDGYRPEDDGNEWRLDDQPEGGRDQGYHRRD
jgi:hypothetical protein